MSVYRHSSRRFGADKQVTFPARLRANTPTSSFALEGITQSPALKVSLQPRAGWICGSLQSETPFIQATCTEKPAVNQPDSSHTLSHRNSEPSAASSHLWPGARHTSLLVPAVLTQSEVGDDTGEDEGCQEGQGEDEGIEVAIVALPHAVAHPGAVVIKPL